MSRDFNGSTGELVLELNAILRPSTPVTITAWINPDTLKIQGIFHTNKLTTTHRGFWFDMADASGHLSCNYGDNGGSTAADRRSRTSTGTVSTGSWQAVACRMRGSGASDMDIWIAGADAGGSNSGTGAGVQHFASAAGRIGTVAGTNFFDGRIAEVGFWNVSLSDAELLALSKGVSPKMIRPESLLVHHPIWGVAVPEVDLSPNSLEAPTLNGTANLANHCPVGPPVMVAV